MVIAVLSTNTDTPRDRNICPTVLLCDSSNLFRDRSERSAAPPCARFEFTTVAASSRTPGSASTRIEIVSEPCWISRLKSAALLFGCCGNRVRVVRASVCGAIPVVAVVAAQAAVRLNVKNGEDKVQHTLSSGPGYIRTAAVWTNRMGQLKENIPHPFTLVTRGD